MRSVNGKAKADDAVIVDVKVEDGLAYTVSTSNDIVESRAWS
jgi:hypothetical protein